MLYGGSRTEKDVFPSTFSRETDSVQRRGVPGTWHWKRCSFSTDADRTTASPAKDVPFVTVTGMTSS